MKTLLTLFTLLMMLAMTGKYYVVEQMHKKSDKNDIHE